jgi:Fic family protein
MAAAPPSIDTQRAGAYEAQEWGYRAFIPKRLPPDPPLTFDVSLATLLSDAASALGRLDGVASNLPGEGLFLGMYATREAVLSTRIEGTQASLVEVLTAQTDAKETRSADLREAQNYLIAMYHGLDRLASLPLSLRLLREIHAKLLDGTRGAHRNPGEFRTTQNWIGAPGSDLTTARFVPPPPGKMKTALGDLEVFLHSEETMPALIRVALAHAQFETIHPFLDGNGRVGRLLITFLLCTYGVLQAPLLYLSSYLEANRRDYYEHLQAVRDAGDWEGWVRFFLRGVADVAREATDTARDILGLRESHRQLIMDELGKGAGRGLQLLESLYQQPVVTNRSVAETLGIAPANATPLVGRLVDLRLLQEITGQRRNRRYVYRQYLDLFPD